MTRQAVLVPGRLYGPNTPLLFYAGWAALHRQATVERLDWPSPSGGDPLAGDSAYRQAWVLEHVASVLARLGGTPLLIGKSLGTYAAALAAQRSLPAVWYTPLLLDELVVASLRNSSAPFLLIGGTSDPDAWDGQLARELTPYVCEIQDADHGLMVPTGLAASAAVLGEVTTAVERFLDDVVWPTA
jgi:pimeloyl-ACP methyl ester carboxylesterase